MAMGLDPSGYISEIAPRRNVRGKRTRNPGYQAGNHWVECDICGSHIRSGDAMITWDNLVVCPDDWEIRHPQDFVRAQYDKIMTSEPRRSESEDIGVDGLPLTTPGDGDDVPPISQFRLPVVGTPDSLDISNFSNSESFSLDRFGTRIYILDISPSRIRLRNMSPAFNVLSATSDDQTLELTASPFLFTNGISVSLSILGNKIVCVNISGDVVVIDLSTSFDLSTATMEQKTLAVFSPTKRSLKFDPAGTRFWGISADNLTEFTLSDAFDFTNVTQVADINISSDVSGSAEGFTFDSFGTTLYIGNNLGRYHEYSLTTAFDITTATFTGRTTDNFIGEPCSLTPDNSNLISMRATADILSNSALTPA